MIRLQEKSNYIETVFNNLKSEPIEYDGSIEIYKKIKISGEIDKTKYLWLYRRHPAAKYIDGAYLIMPLTTKNSAQILTILGWVREEDKQEVLNGLNSQISLEGITMPGEIDSFLIPKNDYNTKHCFTMNLDEISEYFGINKNDKFISAIDRKGIENSKIIPISPSMIVNIRNNHLEYAATWYGLAVIFCYIYYFFLKKQKKMHLILNYIGYLLLFFGITFITIGMLGIIRFPDKFAKLHGAGVADSLGFPLCYIGLALITANDGNNIKYIILLFAGLFLSPIVTHSIAKAANKAENKHVGKI